MRHLIPFVATALVAVALPAVADQRITVPAKTPVSLVSDSTINGQVAVTPGTQVLFHVATPVVVGGYVVIPQDAKAYGHLVSGGGMKIHQQVFGARREEPQVIYVLDYVVSADGGKIKLDPENQTPPEMEVGPQTKTFIYKQTNKIQMLQVGSPVTGKVDGVVHVNAKTKAGATGDYDK